MNAELAERQSLGELDRRHLIHPVSSWSEHSRLGPRILRSGQGAYLTDIDGRTFLDGFSGLWCVNVGYGQQTVVAAAAEQMSRLPYATGYFGFSSEPAILLADRLTSLAPDGLNHVYFTLSGSDSVDSAVRFITYYWRAISQPNRCHYISLDRGYHGSSAVGAGITGLAAFHRNFALPLSNQHYIPAPYAYRSSSSEPDTVIANCVEALVKKVSEVGAENVAAFFCEPVMGSGGVIVPPRGWLRAMRETCRKLGILFVADEVITGFGRTGPMFACEHEGVVPDLMTLAKGLTSGYAPMGAVLLSDSVYRGIADNTPDGSLIGHGTTYSAHPVSAAVALEVLRLYTDGGLIENGYRIGKIFESGLRDLYAHPLVGDVRVSGLLAAIELVSNKATKARLPENLNIAQALTRLTANNGLILRIFLDGTIALAPPLCCTESDMRLLLERLRKTLNDLISLKEVRDALD